MRKTAYFGPFLAILLLTSFGVWAEPRVFTNANVLPMDAPRILYGQTLVVEDGVITYLGPPETAPLAEDAGRIDLEGRYLMPGFVDAHFHQGGEGTGYVGSQFKLLVANGVTTAVNMAEWPGQDAIAVREFARTPGVIAPNYFTSGPQVNQSNVGSAEDARRMAEMHRKKGYDFLKIHSNLNQDAYTALLKAADEYGIQVVGHTQRDKPVEVSLDMDLIVHMEDLVMVYSDENALKIAELSEDEARDIARKVKRAGVTVSPTLLILARIQDFTDPERLTALKQRDINKYLPKELFDEHTAPGQRYLSDFFVSPAGLKYVDDIVRANEVLTRALHKAGVPLLVGSDNFGLQITGFSVHEEMASMVALGLPEYDVLRAATAASADFLERDKIAGTIEQGKLAEFVVLNGNPLENIEHTRDIAGVMVRGQWFGTAELNAMLSEVEQTFAPGWQPSPLDSAGNSTEQ